MWPETKCDWLSYVVSSGHHIEIDWVVESSVLQEMKMHGINCSYGGPMDSALEGLHLAVLKRVNHRLGKDQKPTSSPNS